MSTTSLQPVRISKYGRSWFYWPFWGLQGKIPSISINGTAWVAMTAQPLYVPVTPVAVGAEWFRVLIAGSGVVSNPVGTLVITAPRNNALFMVTDDDEIEIPTNDYQVIEVV